MRELLHHASPDLQALDAAYFERKAAAQRSIVRSGEDARILKQAMLAFRSLQHVQILRLQDEADRCLIDYLYESDENRTRLVDLRWTPACYHALRTMCEALEYGRSKFTRFSGPMMNPQSALAVKKNIPRTITFLAEHLTCLELHFDDHNDLTRKMKELSPFFKLMFTTARGMQAVHIGFPSREPLDLHLEEIFHNVHWEKLRAFGVQSWRLSADEIIDLARRHRKTLRGLRLRDVQLRDGSMWKTVLAMLREEMELLDWVSLRRIDYASHFDEVWAGSMEVLDTSMGNASDSDEEDRFQAHILEEEAFEYADESFDDGGSEERSNADTDYGPDANELALSPDTPVSLPFCTCSRSSYPATADDLVDNGRCVMYQQRKMWEKWVVGRCPEHSGG